jgi:hypothetical protein
MLENIIRPEKESNAGDIGNDSFLLCFQQKGFIKSEPPQQCNNDHWKEKIVVDNNHELQPFCSIGESNKISWMDKKQIGSHEHPNKQWMKNNRNKS